VMKVAVLIMLFLITPVFARAGIIASNIMDNNGDWTLEAPLGGEFLLGPRPEFGFVPTAGTDVMHYATSSVAASGTNFITFAGIPLAVGDYTVTIDVGDFNNAAFCIFDRVSGLGMTAGGNLLTPTTTITPTPAPGQILQWSYSYSIAPTDPLLGQNIGFTITVPFTGIIANAAFDNLNIDFTGSVSVVAQSASASAIENLAFSRPVVAKDVLPGFAFHQIAHITDGIYGNPNSWIGNSADSWIKIDLGQPTVINRVTFGRDRLGILFDRDPGRFTVELALTDNVFLIGNDSNDSAEYVEVLDSLTAAGGFTGTIALGDTIQASFSPATARYVKLTFANLGAAIDEVEIFAAPSHFIVISYIVPANTAGNQAFGGSLGMDFDVNSMIIVTRLGVFDDGSDGLFRTITAHLYDRNAPVSPLRTLVFTPGDPGELVDGSRFLDLATPLELPAGFQGTIVAEGYGDGERSGNSGVSDFPRSTSDGGGAISFVGNSRFGNTPGLYPTGLDGGPANRYAAGTFQFGSPPIIPTLTEWGIFALMLVLAMAAFLRVRKMKLADRTRSLPCRHWITFSSYVTSRRMVSTGRASFRRCSEASSLSATATV